MYVTLREQQLAAAPSFFCPLNPYRATPRVSQMHAHFRTLILVRWNHKEHNPLSFLLNITWAERPPVQYGGKSPPYFGKSFDTSVNVR